MRYWKSWLKSSLRTKSEDSQLGTFYMMEDQYAKALQTMELAYKQGYLEKESEIKALAQLYATNEIPIKSAQLQETYIGAD